MIEYIKELLSKLYYAFCVDGDDFENTESEEEQEKPTEDIDK